MNDRLSREKEFHNETFATGSRKSVKKYYSTTDISKGFYRDQIYKDVAGKKILEYGCGPGSQAFTLAEKGAEVYAIDISDVAIEQTQEKAKAMGLDIHCSVMDAENLSFPDDNFDLVCGSGILHHLDLEKAYPELKRVLKPGGKGIFFEPMGYNPFINLYRNLTPSMRTEDEHPLLMEDFELAENYFDNVTPHFFHLTSFFSSFIPGAGLRKAASKPLNRIDRVLIERVPFLRKYAWIAVVELG